MELIFPQHQIISPINGTEILRHLELCGRVCYKSENKISETSSTNMIKHLLTNQHMSVIEHFNLTIKFITDRGVTHELVRHRLAAYSQESTRYVNYKNNGCLFVIPWNILMEECSIDMSYTELYDQFFQNELLENEWAKIWIMSMHIAEKNYIQAINNGVTPQDARGILPNSTKTEIMVTTNLREWMHILDLRCSSKAHPEMQRLMIPLLYELNKKIPILFDDLSDKYKQQMTKWKKEIERFRKRTN